MAEPPYRRIAAAIAEQIRSGRLRPGDPVPSTRAVTREWNVAMATAAKALGLLRQQGWVRTRPGAATVVATPPAAARGPEAVLEVARIVRAAMDIADDEGMSALSMRRLAADLGVPPTSLYRHVSGREQLVLLMIRSAFGARPLPEPGPDGWEAKLRLVCRLQWDLYREHPWLAEHISLTRPLLVPEAMAQTEWTLRALDGLGLSPAELTTEVIALSAFVGGMALLGGVEVKAQRDTGLTSDQWWVTRDAELNTVLRAHGFSRLGELSEEIAGDLDAVFEHGLERHLSGLRQRLSGGGCPGR
ncbi:TetR/AcrR family transcriptional regulator C-terminal domain-containing protein [Amycolatopsis suaedae]|uniref:GntR family transcriptional regulator n=1 Tax=Amycolatopsis suaedae TaxID=2510978 RepID=A0A4V2EM48_9PSEU|nr:TetR/AcrR family transcriptional regulator C-terminal domain-containing protein [Amycolatopsis suaedae]RZQ63815.1 GntR family transcriptional regulator [Amycolatopsis suaedae]